MARAFTICLILSVAAGCGLVPDSARSENRYDAGAFFSDDPEQIVHTFRLRNGKRTTLTVTDIIKSCNCASVTADRRIVGPGETLALDMRVDLAKGVGNWRVVSTVKTNDSEAPERAFELLYRTYPRTRFNVGSLDFGQVTDPRPLAQASNIKVRRSLK
jgi:hypothetical protein